ncbi:putative Predicted signal transduction protein [Vibrio coralliirubri]|uniref:EAL domain-containing protein n=1 Tax=Vibrio coralliirubri TaxID=1516159 RepID=UPI000636E3E7|nr:EAL domain-containing protein [Vibrio coralliirubri]CDT15314.1 putative Predicted signal transduction protein [Vibrio coralliirubri]
MKNNTERQLSRLQSVFDSARDGLWIMDGDNAVTFYNTAFYSQFNLPCEGMTLEDWTSLIHPEDKSVFAQRVSAQREGKEPSRVISRYRVRNISGRYIWIEAEGLTVSDNSENYMVGTHRDISEEVLINDYLKHAAQHDEETGIFNRQKFMQDISSLSTDHLVITISMFKFNHIFRYWGRDTPKRVSAVLSSCLDISLGSEYEFYRVSTDIFVATYSRENNPISANEALIRFEKALQQYCDDNGLAKTGLVGVGVFNVSGSIQIADSELIPNLSEYMRDKGCNVVYEGEMKSAVDRHFLLRDALLEAVEYEQITLAMQPIVSVYTDEVTSYECLARWHHPILGVIPPLEFIPLAEQLGLINQLGLSLLKQACQFLKAHDLTSKTRPHINVNVSVKQLVSKDYVADTHRVVCDAKLMPERVVLEITESHLLDDSDVMSSRFEQLVNLGYQLSLDDFGSGLSSMTSLFRLPLAQLKLDKQIVVDAMSSRACRDFVTYLATHAKAQRIMLVAEGVEDEQIMTSVKVMGVTHLQGFGLHRPMPPKYWIECFGS